MNARVFIRDFPVYGSPAKVRDFRNHIAPNREYLINAPRILDLQCEIAGPHFVAVQDGHMVAATSRGLRTLQRTRCLVVEKDGTCQFKPDASRLRLPGEVVAVGGKAANALTGWMAEILPRLELVHEHRALPLVMRPSDLPFQRETFEILGLKPHFVTEDVIMADGFRIPEHVLLARGRGQFSPALIDLTRRFARRLPVPVQGRLRRLYFTTGHTDEHAFDNEADLVGFLGRLHFETIDPAHLSLSELVALFAEAEFVVSAHSNVLACLCFCRPGTGVLELYPDRHPSVSPYWSIASLAGLEYRMLLCRTGDFGLGDARHVSLTADIDMLEDALQTLIVTDRSSTLNAIEMEAMPAPEPEFSSTLNVFEDPLMSPSSRPLGSGISLNAFDFDAIVQDAGSGVSLNAFDFAERFSAGSGISLNAFEFTSVTNWRDADITADASFRKFAIDPLESEQLWREFLAVQDPGFRDLIQTPEKAAAFIQKKPEEFVDPLNAYRRRLELADPRILYARIVPSRSAEPYGRKYLDFSKHLLQNLEKLHSLGLHRTRRMRILDIGAGPGFFCYAARLYGHHSVALERSHDRKLRSVVSYPAILDFFGVPLSEQRIDAQKPIALDAALGDAVGQPLRFNLVTAFAIMFNLNNKYYWTADDYLFLLDDLKTRFLTADGRVILKFNAPIYDGDRDRMSDEGHAYYKALGELLRPFVVSYDRTNGALLDLANAQAWSAAMSVSLPKTERLSSTDKDDEDDEDDLEAELVGS